MIASILLCLNIQAQQNLVPNPSFEEYTECPSMIFQWQLAVNWTSANGLSADYFHRCAPESVNYSAHVPNNILGWQPPYEGDAYMGIIAFSDPTSETREFIQTELVDSLTAGIRYAIGFQACAADRFQYAISTLGAALTETPPPVITVVGPNGMVDANPQVMLDDRIPITDTAKWVLICDTVLAQGGERYLTIGNFHLDGESDTLRFNPNQPPIYGSPTTYAYYYIDDVSVIALDSVPSGIEEQEALGFELWPNPAKEFVQFRISDSSARSSVGMTLQVMDAVGRVLRYTTLRSGTQDDHTIDLSSLPSGVYFLELKDTEGKRSVSKFVKE
ncbi:MAG: T9SS type A sorting domain-containing protein [Flavobacteriales bacterium]|nr:T9SS type A sorting domain-containing protein [Flavobacteriales bacterium]